MNRNISKYIEAGKGTVTESRGLKISEMVYFLDKHHVGQPTDAIFYMMTELFYFAFSIGYKQCNADAKEARKK